VGHSVRSLVLGLALVALGTGMAGAQVPKTYVDIGVPKGGTRMSDYESRQPPPAEGDVRFLRAYRFNTTSEMMYMHFRGELGGKRDYDVADDSASLEPGETTPVSLRLDYHVFTDLCADAGHKAGDSTMPCKTWLRGADKRRAFHQSGRIPLEGADPVWVDRATFTWLVRDHDGKWVRWQLIVADDGLTKDWKRHDPYSMVAVMQLTHVNPPAPAPAPPGEQAPTAQEPPPPAPAPSPPARPDTQLPSPTIPPYR